MDYEERPDQALARTLASAPPDAVVIHLGRLPSHGRAIALHLRERQATRSLPLVFVDGAPDKVARLAEELPDALYTTGGRLLADLPHARPGALVPAAASLAAPGKPVAAKLGLTEPGQRICVHGAPREFPALLGALPAGVVFTEEPAEFTLFFAPDEDTLREALPELRRAARRGRLWIAWRKQGARKKPGALTAPAIRERAAHAGLVDFKICSLGEEWSAMAFALRRESTR